MKYKKGDKLICIKQIINMLGDPLFIKGETYEILHIDNDIHDNILFITLDHIMYGNEYGDFTKAYVDKNFRDLKKLRKQKLKNIENGININKSL
jgi:hypothetical protein